MMIPITRKEKYINEIVGGGNTAPETPQTREELFFADILGEVVAPSPITRAEKYLAKIANKYSGELPEPVTRVERFLARAAGMDISVPTPVTREEMFWADYAFIVEKEISGIPPLTFNAIAGTLKNYRIYGNTETLTRSYSGTAPLSFPIVDGSVSNYRIYGNTENGESVGDLVTDNQSEHYGNYAIPITNNSETANIYLDEPLRKVGDEAEYVDYATQKWHRVRKNLCPYESNNNTIIGHVKQGKTYTFSFYALYECGFNLQKRNADSGQTTMFIVRSNCNGNVEVTFQADENFDVYFNGYSRTTGKATTDCVSKLQLEESSAATSYEPYIENTEVDVTIPDLPAQSSSNSLSVGTAVQPSSLAVDVAEVVSCGDKVTDSQSVNYGKYKIPVTLTAGSAETTDIYLDTPLAKSGNNADYIDYATQKRHNSDGTESTVILPEIAVTAGTNTLTVGTEVQPSDVYIKYEGAR